MNLILKIWELPNQDATYVQQNSYAFVRYNNDSDGRTLLLAVTNQITNDVEMKGVKATGFKPNDKICNLVTVTTDNQAPDCLVVSAGLTVDILIKAGGLPKIYTRSN